MRGQPQQTAIKYSSAYRLVTKENDTNKACNELKVQTETDCFH